MPEKAQKGNKQKKEGPATKEELYQDAVKLGLNKLASQPGLSHYNVLIRNNVDNKKLYNFIEETEKKFGPEGPSNDKQYKEMYQYLASYVASGNALKEPAKQTLLDKGLNKSALEKIANFFDPNRLEGEKYFEKARGAYSDMYDILSQDKAAQQKFPELVKAAEAMKMYGFLDIALKNFKSHGMMDDKTYKMLSKELHKTTVMKSQKGIKGLEGYILTKEEKEAKEDKNVQKIAASVVGFAGIMLMLSNLNMTGAVIGGNNTITAGVIGLFMFFLALLLFFRPLKRSFKK